MRARAVPIVAVLAVPACMLAPRTDPLVLEDFVPGSAGRVAVVPFGGEDGYPRVTGEWVAFRLSEARRAEIVSPEESGVLLRDAGVPWPAEDPPPDDVVRAAAAALGADVVVHGRTSRAASGPRTQPAFGIALRVWDGPSGRLLGETTVFNRFVTATSDVPVIGAAADAVAAELLRAVLGVETAREEED